MNVYARGIARFLGAAATVLFVATLASHSFAALQATGGSGYHLAKRVVLGGDGLWDYLEVDPNTHHVLITRATRVMVVDPDQGKQIGEIPKTHFVHGIAVAPELKRGFTTNGDTSAITIFDTSTLQTIGEATTGKEPDAILYDPSSKRVFAMNRTGTSTVVDAATGRVIGTVPLGGQPEFGVADGKGHVFVDIEDRSELVDIDSKAMKVEHTWPLAPCTEPSGLAIDAAHERLIVGCHNKMMAFVNGTNGKVIGTVPIGQGVDADRFDPGTGLAFASCGDGTLTVAREDSPDQFTLVDTVKTEQGARTMAIDLATHTVYLVTAKFGPRPAPTADNPRPSLTLLPDSFTLLVLTK